MNPNNPSPFANPAIAVAANLLAPPITDPIVPEARSNETHDTYYLQYLEKTYGATSVPFFGVILCIMILLVTTIIIMFNMVTGSLAASESDQVDVISPNIEMLIESTKSLPPIIFYDVSR